MKGLGNKAIFARNLNRLMREREITPKTLSRSLGYPYTTVLSWANGECYPRIDKIEAMAAYFDVMKSDLIEERITGEKEKDNEHLADIIVRMRLDADFCALVKSLYMYDAAKIKGIRHMLHAFSEQPANEIK